MAAHIEVNVFVGEELKCQVFITDEQKEIDLTTTRNDVLQVVKDFLPLNFLFTKPVGKQESARIPVAPGQETFVILGKCLVHDEDDSLNLYLQQTESAGKRPSSTLNSPKPKRLRQQPVYKYFQTSGMPTTSAADYSAARGRVYLYTESTIEKATDRRKGYYRSGTRKWKSCAHRPAFQSTQSKNFTASLTLTGECMPPNSAYEMQSEKKSWRNLCRRKFRGTN